MNWIAILVAALVPLALGFVWYHPKVLGTAWMKESGMTEEKAQSSNMLLIFGLSFVFAIMLSVSLQSITIHQYGVESVLMNAAKDPAHAADAKAILSKFRTGGVYATEFRSFGHGMFHGILLGLFLILPVFATNAMYERKSFKYMMINVLYWVLSLGIMGGIICAWV